MTFFVELPADEFGNRAYTARFPCVIEGEIKGRELIIKAPPEIANRWSHVIASYYGGWMEVSGPARPITELERDELIRSGQGDQA